ncbi:hypothetical protein P7K49_018525 [Saguinus oedipus]|uniref:Uncharacterized protein n=1 Tax=Saguinus oedipus TaxID=9490 RepID=A0ABQ9V5M5_SAGOE|nr:hypothetical protein P7K49_018525 [Saguinus oedipus]
MTSCDPAPDCSPATSIAGRVSCWDTVERSGVFSAAPKPSRSPPPDPAAEPARASRGTSRTGSLLAGAGPSPAAPVTMVRGAVGGVAAMAGAPAGRGLGSEFQTPTRPRRLPTPWKTKSGRMLGAGLRPPAPRGRAAEEVQLGPESPPPARPPRPSTGAGTGRLQRYGSPPLS